jgi:hypothetical protein
VFVILPSNIADQAAYEAPWIAFGPAAPGDSIVRSRYECGPHRIDG